MKTTIQELAQELADLEASLIEVTHEFDVYLEQIPKDQRVAAINLIQYLYFRSKDRKSLQEKLHYYGFSALSNSENHLHRQVQTIRERLGHTYAKGELNPCTYKFSRKRLEQNSKLLFGKQAQAKMPSVMVTFATDFAENPELIERLLLNGMQVARINCAHDDQGLWLKMIKQIKAAEKWIRYVGERDGIDICEGLPTLIKSIGADAFEYIPDVKAGKLKGVWTHTNVRKDKVDMFPQPELMDMLVSL